MEEMMRLRLKFNDGDILSNSQKFDGLRRSWILVEPRHRTISDVVSHLLGAFELSDSCPNGVLLSKDGFVLPPFESTEILKDKDIVCIKRKRAKLLDVAKESGEETAVLEKLPVVPGLQLLASEEFEKEIGGYLNETEEGEDKLQNELLHHHPNGGALVKKRKASEQSKNSEKEKHRQSDGHSAYQERGGGCLQNGGELLKSKRDQALIPKAANSLGAVKRKANTLCSSLNENREGAGTSYGLTDEPQKRSVSRSANRKKKQKLWLKGLSEAERTAWKQLRKKKPPEDLNAVANKDQNFDPVNKPEEPDQDSETGDEIIPVIVRPGHIRFSAPGKEKSVLQRQEAKESFNWHGSVNKKKNKKRGKKKQLFSKWNEHQAPHKIQSASKWSDHGPTREKKSASLWDDHRSNQEKNSPCAWDDLGATQEKKSAWGEYRSPQDRPSRYRPNEYGNRGKNWASQRAQPAGTSIDYEKLIPLTDFPVEGDIIAYRLLGLNSLSCPELTSYRIGKVSQFEAESNSITLVPVPEYPFKFKTAVDHPSGEVPDASRYKEDGSLEIDFPSLADVRTVKRGYMNPSTTFHSEASGTPSSGLNPTSSWNPASSGWNPTSSGSGWSTRNPTGNKYPSSSQVQPTSQRSGWGSASGSGSGTTSVSGWRPGTSVPTSPAQPASGNWNVMNGSPASAPENGSKDVWEELSSALSAKKAEDIQEDNWKKKRACASRLLSSRAPRGRGFGSASRFRAQNRR